MKTTKISAAAIGILLVAAALGMAQKNRVQVKPSPSPTPASAPDLQPIRSSAAYAELLLRKTELQSTLDSLRVDYTEDYPKIRSIRVELGFLKSELDRVLAVKPADAGRLTLALGRLMLRKVELETELDVLRVQYKDEHPEVKKLKNKIDAFEAAISEILS